MLAHSRVFVHRSMPISSVRESTNLLGGGEGGGGGDEYLSFTLKYRYTLERSGEPRNASRIADFN